MGDEAAQALQQLAAGASALLFIGYGAGFEDPNFEQWLAFLRRTQGPTEHRHFRIVRAGEYDAARHLHAHDNIVPLPYGAEYGELPAFLRSLAPAPPAAPPRAGSARLRRPGPCIGRDRVVEELAQAMLRAEPACLLGPGGGGKTTVSLAALHDPRVAGQFGARRFFVYGEAANSRHELLQIAARDTGVTPGDNLEARLWQHLAAAPAALVLDNLETAWLQDSAAVEAFLAELTALPQLALCASIRGRQRPLNLHWGLLAEITPLDADTARAVFLEYAGEAFAADPDLPQLVREQDGLPLALRLLAAQAQGAPNLALLRREWVARKTEMLRSGDTRLDSLAVSAELSIGRLAPPALRLLGLLALLPEGAAETDLPELLPDDTFAAARGLRQSALAYDAGGRLRLLRPLRDYTQRSRTPETADKRRVLAFYCGLAAAQGGELGREGGAEAAERLAAELGNLETLIPEALDGADVAAGVKAAIGTGELLRFTGLGSRAWLELARAAAQTDAQRADCLKKLGDVAWIQSDNDGARRFFGEAMPLYEKIGSLLGKANCLKSLGDMLKAEGDMPGAVAQWQAALGLYRRINDHYSTGWTLRRLALSSEGETRRQYLEEARAAWQHMPYLWKNLDL